MVEGSVKLEETETGQKIEEKKGGDKKPEIGKEKGKKTEKEKIEKKTEPSEIKLKVFIHCEGCCKKIKRCLKELEGVEDVLIDNVNHVVVVKGKNADPLKVLEKVQKKSHGKVELLTPIPKPKSVEKIVEVKKEEPKPVVKKEEPPVVSVVIKVHMHCDACADEIQKRIQKMKGVESASSDLKSSQVTVKGPFDPTKLVDFVLKKCGRHASILKIDTPNQKKKEVKPKEIKDGKKVEKTDEKKNEKKKGGNQKVREEQTNIEINKNQHIFHYPQNIPPQNYEYVPQLFSDENPNACTIM